MGLFQKSIESNKMIFCFSRRTYNILLLGTPWDRLVAKVDDVSTYRSEVIFITYLTYTRKGMKWEGEVIINYHTMIRCATKILKKLFDDILVITSRMMHKLWEFIQFKNDIKLSVREMLKIVNSSLILSWIREGCTSVDFNSWIYNKCCGDWFGIWHVSST